MLSNRCIIAMLQCCACVGRDGGEEAESAANAIVLRCSRRD